MTTSPEHGEYIAGDAAEDFYHEHDGWEDDWPKTIRVFGVGLHGLLGRHRGSPSVPFQAGQLLSQAVLRKAVVGTAGRREDAGKLNLPLYLRMFWAVQTRVDPEDDVMSGGAAVADHIAVLLWLGGWCRSLTLYLPAKFDFPTARFDSSRDGQTANRYHVLFSSWLGADSMRQIVAARDLGARVEVVPGFLNRNIPVGEVDEVLALTFGTGAIPKDGGTRHTWDNSKAPSKVHIPIGSLR